MIEMTPAAASRITKLNYIFLLNDETVSIGYRLERGRQRGQSAFYLNIPYMKLHEVCEKLNEGQYLELIKVG